MLKINYYVYDRYSKDNKRAVSGYQVVLERPGHDHDVCLAVRKSGKGWVVDHPRSGCGVSQCGGQTRKGAVDSIENLSDNLKQRIFDAHDRLPAIDA